MIIKVLKSLFRKPFTTNYPKEKSNVTINFRGSIHVDQKKCIACRLCEINCPTGAIIVIKEKKYAVVDRNLCILCGLCAEVCPVNVIWFSKDQTSVNKRSELKKQLPGENPTPGSRSIRAKKSLIS
jgi:formate hydrogenlyase subunit 6/NADH:ubiquinone oxidoreductase subunit I